MRQKKEINIQIGEQVRLAREQAKLTQEQLAEQIEVSPQYVSDLERGVVGISIPTLKRLCCTVGVTSDQILFGTKSMDRGMDIANRCSQLSETQFSILTDIIGKFIDAIDSTKENTAHSARQKSD